MRIYLSNMLSDENNVRISDDSVEERAIEGEKEGRGLSGTPFHQDSSCRVGFSAHFVHLKALILAGKRETSEKVRGVIS